MAALNGDGSSSDVEAPANAFVSPLQHDMWTCPLEPSSPGAVFARKLARRPSVDAISLTANFTSVASSAARSPRPGRRFSSRSPGPASVCTAVSSIPNPSSAGTRASTNRS